MTVCICIKAYGGLVPTDSAISDKNTDAFSQLLRYLRKGYVVLGYTPTHFLTVAIELYRSRDHIIRKL
jgi:hypothetical protein